MPGKFTNQRVHKCVGVGGLGHRSHLMLRLPDLGVSGKGPTVLFSEKRLRGRRMEDLGYMVLGVAVAVLGIVLTYAYEHRSQPRRQD